MAMDFDPDVTGIASQPLWLHWRDEDGQGRRHAPDFFARRADGSGLVVNVRPDDRIGARDAAVFQMTALACGQAGWEFRRAGAIDPVVRANIRWLSRYRHQRCRVEPAVLRDVQDEHGGVIGGGHVLVLKSPARRSRAGLGVQGVAGMFSLSR
jgi:hypothetical protein